MAVIRDSVSAVGRLVVNFFEDAGAAVILWMRATILVFIPPLHLRIIFKQCEQIGLRSLPVVIVSATFIGMVFGLHTYSGFTRFGASGFTPPVVALAITREMGPVITALMVAGRAGAAMTAEIGSMKVTEQIDALRTLATNPIKYLAVPRLIAATIMLPLLTVFADACGLFGGYIISTGMMGMSSQLYLRSTWDALLPSDIFGGLMKSTFFGFFIALICTHYGFRTKGGAEGVGVSTTKSVVAASMSVLISDFFLTRILQWG
jgi:phospholipid/cholesterol/gamma-HCH transport system permease protein